MLSPEFARAFYHEIVKINAAAPADPSARARALYELLSKIFVEATKQENFFFSTLFARISYAGHRFSLSEPTLRLVHSFRRAVEQASKSIDNQRVSEKTIALGLRAVAESILVLSHAAMPAELLEILPLADDELLFQKPETWDFKQKTRVVAVADDPENQALICWEEENASQPIRVLYGLPDRNDNFLPTIQAIRAVFGFPLTMNLLEVDIDQRGFFRPRAFVVEPDFLVDVSAVSEIFSQNGAEPLHFLVKKFMPYEKTPAILIGNVANFFLDELMNDPEADFKKLIRQAFLLDPLVFSTLNDQTVHDIAAKAQRHFVTLQNMVRGGFAQQGIALEDCLLEPSFFSETHGLQGRLDVFCKNPTRPAIVELKSGQAFMPNSYGIGVSHFTQTLLYDLLVKTVFGHALAPANYILYSGAESEPLKFAPVVVAQQLEALQIRNQLVAIERLLQKILPATERVPIFEKISGKMGAGFVKRDFEAFEKSYSGLDAVEKKYVHSFVGFLAREQALAKIGSHDREKINGHAALWLQNLEEKTEAFEVLNHLQLIENQAFATEPFLVFERSEATSPLANFRVGDIAVLWPWREDGDSAVTAQVIKCTITELGKNHVRVSLRARQSNLQIFEEAAVWHLEHDLLDSSFTASYRSLFEFMNAPKAKRDLLLTRTAPSLSEVNKWHIISNENIDFAEQNLMDTDFEVNIIRNYSKNEFEKTTLSQSDRLKGRQLDERYILSNESIDFAEQNLIEIDQEVNVIRNSSSEETRKLTAEQAHVLEKIIHSRDYFLLWGPPGTGKTSVMLSELVRHFFEKTDENLLLLAYTNRAVDEICEAIESLGEAAAASYLRIGSRHATADRFKKKLLNAKISAATKRREIVEILQGHRIFVGTIASFSGSYELFALKKLHRLFIDEASQILEPSLLSLLARFDHFTLIGDHKQLPAVSSQTSKMTVVEDENLNALGLVDLRDSLFERLFRRCQAENWHWAFDRLSHQGRMHAEIMAFPNRHFYHDFLKILPYEMIDVHPQLIESRINFLSKNRVVFISTKTDDESLNGKTNRHEAEQVAQLFQQFRQIFQENGWTWKPSTFGVITPYRAQIAQIRATLKHHDLDDEALTIDTVERYQGGAREIIVISLCVNNEFQLSSLVSLNAEGVDRKLNVALTRAREQVVVLGNEFLLRKDARYLDFIERYRVEK